MNKGYTIANSFKTWNVYRIFGTINTKSELSKMCKTLIYFHYRALILNAIQIKWLWESCTERLSFIRQWIIHYTCIVRVWFIIRRACILCLPFILHRACIVHSSLIIIIFSLILCVTLIAHRACIVYRAFTCIHRAFTVRVSCVWSVWILECMYLWN